MPGALDLTESKHLLAKLGYELGALSADHDNSYAPIKASRDAYHLREWAWHDRRKHDLALQAAIMGSAADKKGLGGLGKSAFSGFPCHSGAMQRLQALRT